MRSDNLDKLKSDLGMLRPMHLLTTQLEAPTTTIPTLGCPSILREALLKALKDNDKADIKSKDSFHVNLLNPSEMNNAFLILRMILA